MIIGHKINKINVNVGEAKGKLEIKSGVNIKGMERRDFHVAGGKKPGIEFRFNFTANYGDAGKIEVEGAVFYTDEKAVMDKIEKQWNKDKKIDEDQIVPVINRAMAISYTEAIILADRVNLPSPLRMPRVSPKNK